MATSLAPFGLASVPKTKLTPPTAPLSEVRRKALIERFDSAEFSRVVLVHAPAGFGKTTAMIQLNKHLLSQNIETAWLTLEQSDNDVSRFLLCLNAALMNWSASEPLRDGTQDLTDFISQRETPFAIFLDDVEELRSPATLALLRSIIDILPSHGHLIIGSRSRPDIGIARLRVHAKILEIDAALLRFDITETLTYFQLRQLKDMPIEWLQRLQDKTEGWVAALWLASLSIERTGFNTDFVDRFSVTDQAVADFLADDVLAHQSEQTREFLLRTSILRYLEPALCEALVPGCNALDTLAALENQNIFLSAIPNQQLAYRYHSLFSNFLRSRLRASKPGDIDQLHLVAAQWYEANGRFVPAIDHAIEGAYYDYALSMLSAKAQSFLEEGRMRLMAKWFRAMPDKLLANHPRLLAVSVWAYLFTYGPLKAHDILQQSGCADSEDPEVLAHVNAQRPLLLAMADRYDEALEAGRQSLVRLPTVNRFADSVLRNAMANIFTVMGNSGEAQRLIDSARSLDGDSIFTRMYAESQEGLLNLLAGRLRQATTCFRMAVRSTANVSTDLTSGNAWAGILYASVLYDSNDFDNAERLVDVYLPLACDVGLPDHMYLGYMIKARIAYYRGEVDKALEALTELEYTAHKRQLARIVASAKLERSRLFLQQGDAQGCLDELDRARDDKLEARLARQRLLANELRFHELGMIRWEIHFGDAHSALRQLDDAIAEAESEKRPLRLIKMRLLQSMAYQRIGEASLAVEVFADVCRALYQEDNIRIVADEGEYMGRIALRYRTILEEMPARNSNTKLLSYLDRLVAAFGHIRVDQEVANEHDTAQMEALTRKEIKVLELTASGCSNAQLAEQLSVSDSTVRTHLRNINAKLKARNRAEAVAIARRLSIIR